MPSGILATGGVFGGSTITALSGVTGLMLLLLVM
jgi:hypothetical protein